jgi:hypothetical protein
MQRRQLLRLGLASTAVLVLAGGAMTFLKPGLIDGKLSLRAREVFTSLARALLDGSLPAEPQAMKAALEGLLARIDSLVGGLPPHAQSELSQLLALLGTAGGRLALGNLRSDWRDAPVPEIQQALQAMRESSVALRRQAYQALHDIVGSAYFSDPSTWSLLGYPGPIKI